MLLDFFAPSKTEITFSAILVTLLSILVLVSVNKTVKNNNFKLFMNIAFLSEAFVLTFFFAKYNFFLGLSIVFVSFYYFVKVPKLFLFPITDSIPKSFFPDNLRFFFPKFGFFFIICIFVYEYHADRIFSTNTLLVLSLSLLLIYYEKIPYDYFNERDMSLMFLFLLLCFLIFPELAYKVIYGYVGEDSGDNWIAREIFVYNLLGKPLAFFLSILGYNVYAKGPNIFFEDLEAGMLREVSVAESCSGIISIIVFSSFFISYLCINKGLDIASVFLFLSGIILSYFSNLLRMAIIVLVGHYLGMDAFLFVHRYLGWLLFTTWMFIFWLLILKLYGDKQGVNS